MLYQMVQFLEVCVSEENTEAEKVTHCQSSHNFSTNCKVIVGGQRIYVPVTPLPVFYFPLVKICHMGSYGIFNLTQLTCLVVTGQTPLHQNDGSRRYMDSLILASGKTVLRTRGPEQWLRWPNSHMSGTELELRKSEEAHLYNHRRS